MLLILENWKSTLFNYLYHSTLFNAFFWFRSSSKHIIFFILFYYHTADTRFLLCGYLIKAHYLIFFIKAHYLFFFLSKPDINISWSKPIKWEQIKIRTINRTYTFFRLKNDLFYTATTVNGDSLSDLDLHTSPAIATNIFSIDTSK